MSCDFWSLENASATTSSRAAADASEALTYLQRGREIIGAVESWLGIAGMVERAEAVVAVACGEYAGQKPISRKRLQPCLRCWFCYSYRAEENGPVG